MNASHLECESPTIPSRRAGLFLILDLVRPRDLEGDPLPLLGIPGFANPEKSVHQTHFLRHMTLLADRRTATGIGVPVAEFLLQRYLLS